MIPYGSLAFCFPRHYLNSDLWFLFIFDWFMIFFEGNLIDIIFVVAIILFMNKNGSRLQGPVEYRDERITSGSAKL